MRKCPQVNLSVLGREQGQAGQWLKWEGCLWCRWCFWRHWSHCRAGTSSRRTARSCSLPFSCGYLGLLKTQTQQMMKSHDPVQAWQNLQYNYDLRCTFKYFCVSDFEGKGWEVNRKVPRYGFRLLLFESYSFWTIICNATKPAEITLAGCFCVVAMWNCKKIRQHLTRLILPLCFHLYLKLYGQT